MYVFTSQANFITTLDRLKKIWANYSRALFLMFLNSSTTINIIILLSLIFVIFISSV